MTAKTVLITAGPTREHLDPIRFISNLSSGELGYELARCAVERGHRVIVISGPTACRPPRGVQVVTIVSSTELERAVLRYFPKADALFMTSAVCDFRPTKCALHKIKRSGAMTVKLTATRDILQRVAARRVPGQWVCGFCLETNRCAQRALQKLRAKKLDMIVASRYSNRENPFGRGTMRPLVLTAEGTKQQWAPTSKRIVARRLITMMENVWRPEKKR